jgi:TatD DNase family protein
MKEKGVGAITIGTDIESSKRAVEIANQNKIIWACIGVHPVKEVGLEKDTNNFDEVEFEKLANHHKVVAIGECGLDYFRLDQVNLVNEKKRQKDIFEAQINFALRHNKALMLHCRDSYDDVLDILEYYKKEFGEKLNGNAHFFAGNIGQAKRFLDLGFTMSFTGVITFTKDYDEVIRYLPIDSIMSETDAPFVAPVPYRGKRNEPQYVIEVVARLAAIKGVGVEEMASKIEETATKVFGLKN